MTSGFSVEERGITQSFSFGAADWNRLGGKSFSRRDWLHIVGGSEMS